MRSLGGMRQTLTSSVVTLLSLVGCSSGESPVTRSITSAPFGATPEGEPVDLFTMTNPNGIEVRAITFGGIIVSLRTPDRDGRLGDIVLGFDALGPASASSLAS